MFETCMKHASSKGSNKLNASQQFTNFRVMIMLPKLILSFIFFTSNLENATKLFKYGLQFPCQPMPNNINGFKKTYYNILKLSIYKYKMYDKNKGIMLPPINSQSNNIGRHQVEVAHANSTYKSSW
jgi:hypothetical protein